MIEGIYRLMMSDYALPVNIGNPHEMSIEEMAKTIIRMTGSSSRIVYKDLPTDDPKDESLLPADPPEVDVDAEEVKDKRKRRARREDLGQREVDVPEVRPDHGVALKVSKGSGQRLREGARIEVAREGASVERWRET